MPAMTKEQARDFVSRVVGIEWWDKHFKNAGIHQSELELIVIELEEALVKALSE